MLLVQYCGVYSEDKKGCGYSTIYGSTYKKIKKLYGCLPKNLYIKEGLMNEKICREEYNK